MKTTKTTAPQTQDTHRYTRYVKKNVRIVVEWMRIVSM